MNFLVLNVSECARDSFFGDNVVPLNLHPSIVDSWKKSDRHIRDPYSITRAPSVSWEPKHDMEQGLKNVAKPYFDYYKNLMSVSDCILGLTNSEGVIIHSQSKKLKNAMNKYNCLPGGLWNEESVGTNPINIIRTEKTHVYFPGEAYYSHNFHEYSCAASPIFHPQTKDVIGVLFLVGLCGQLLPDSMGWVSATSLLIEERLRNYILGENAVSTNLHKETSQIINSYPIVKKPTKVVNSHDITKRPSSVVIGKDPVFLSSLRLAEKAAKTELNVLLTGETGTGKEVFARTIHNNSSRAGGPFVALNCGAIPRELLISELFGYAEGAFTGASRHGYPGRIEQSNGGTLFLDEIGDAPYEVQVGLLRALEEGSVNRLGSVRSNSVNVRILAATSRNLDVMTRDGTFRRDLYYRLSGININVPPLRDRRKDIPLLVDYYLDCIRKKTGRRYIFSDHLLQVFSEFDWPGNVRELKNTVERLTGLAEGDVVHSELFFQSMPGKSTRKETLLETLREANGNISKVAQKLGKSRLTVYRWMKKYCIEHEKFN